MIPNNLVTILMYRSGSQKDRKNICFAKISFDKIPLLSKVYYIHGCIASLRTRTDMSNSWRIIPVNFTQEQDKMLEHAKLIFERKNSN